MLIRRTLTTTGIAKSFGGSALGPSSDIVGLGLVDYGGGDPSANTTFAESAEWLRNVIDGNKWAVVITNPQSLKELNQEPPNSLGLILVPNPREVFWRIHQEFSGQNFSAKQSRFGIRKLYSGSIHSTAFISDDAVIGQRVAIGANAFVGSGTVIQDDVVVGPNTVIGVDGFEIKQIGGKRSHIVHRGGVWVGKGTRIGANCVINKSLFADYTVLAEGCFIDDLVHISHGVKVGGGSIICSGSNISGGVAIGDNVFLGVGTKVSNGVQIQDNAKITIGSIVVTKVAKNRSYSGFYAIESSKWLAQIARNLRNSKANG